CVLFDTRPSSGGTGPLAANETRTFNVVGSTHDFTGQGETAGGCGVPGFSGGMPQVRAVLINVVTVDPSGGGNLKAWATDQSKPSGGIVNYQLLNPPMNNSNAIPVQVR